MDDSISIVEDLGHPFLVADSGRTVVLLSDLSDSIDVVLCGGPEADDRGLRPVDKKDDWSMQEKSQPLEEENLSK